MTFIDKINALIAKLVSILVLVLIVELVYETIMRYFLNYAVVWSFDISYMLYGIIFMLAIPNVEFLDKHVRIEIIYNRLSKRSRTILDIVSYIFLYIPTSLTITYFGWEFFYNSYMIRETSGATMWSPPIYPFKFVIPLTGFLLFLQVLSQLFKKIKFLTYEKK